MRRQADPPAPCPSFAALHLPGYVTRTRSRRAEVLLGYIKFISKQPPCRRAVCTSHDLGDHEVLQWFALSSPPPHALRSRTRPRNASSSALAQLRFACYHGPAGAQCLGGGTHVAQPRPARARDLRSVGTPASSCWPATGDQVLSSPSPRTIASTTARRVLADRVSDEPVTADLDAAPPPVIEVDTQVGSLLAHRDDEVITAIDPLGVWEARETQFLRCRCCVRATRSSMWARTSAYLSVSAAGCIGRAAT